MAVQPTLRRFTVADYYLMAEAGILAEDDRVELIDGEIIEMTAVGGRHVACVNRLTRLLIDFLGDGAIVSPQNPVRVNDYSEPEPDLTVITAREYGDELPTAHDVLLLIEVSDTSLGYDRRRKLPLFAGAGIAEVWIVDLTGQAIERHTDPQATRYGSVERAGRGEMIESRVLPGLKLDVDSVLGPS